jgi:N-acetylglucosamine repressor
VIVNAFNPGRIYVGGEITERWDLLKGPIRDALVAGTIPGQSGTTPVVPDSSLAEYRLLGAVALVTAPGYAALALG